MRVLLAAVAGAGIGFLWYKMVGCKTGSCPITSNPYISMIYGALMGMVMALGAK